MDPAFLFYPSLFLLCFILIDLPTPTLRKISIFCLIVALSLPLLIAFQQLDISTFIKPYTYERYIFERFGFITWCLLLFPVLFTFRREVHYDLPWDRSKEKPEPEYKSRHKWLGRILALIIGLMAAANVFLFASVKLAGQVNWQAWHLILVGLAVTMLLISFVIRPHVVRYGLVPFGLALIGALFWSAYIFPKSFSDKVTEIADGRPYCLIRPNQGFFEQRWQNATFLTFHKVGGLENLLTPSDPLDEWDSTLSPPRDTTWLFVVEGPLEDVTDPSSSADVYPIRYPIVPYGWSFSDMDFYRPSNGFPESPYEEENEVKNTAGYTFIQGLKCLPDMSFIAKRNTKDIYELLGTVHGNYGAIRVNIPKEYTPAGQLFKGIYINVPMSKLLPDEEAEENIEIRIFVREFIHAQSKVRNILAWAGLDDIETPPDGVLEFKHDGRHIKIDGFKRITGYDRPDGGEILNYIQFNTILDCPIEAEDGATCNLQILLEDPPLFSFLPVLYIEGTTTKSLTGYGSFFEGVAFPASFQGHVPEITENLKALIRPMFSQY